MYSLHLFIEYKGFNYLNLVYITLLILDIYTPSIENTDNDVLDT